MINIMIFFKTMVNIRSLASDVKYHDLFYYGKHHIPCMVTTIMIFFTMVNITFLVR